jgi:hypothetical protein
MMMQLALVDEVVQPPRFDTSRSRDTCHLRLCCLRPKRHADLQRLLGRYELQTIMIANTIAMGRWEDGKMGRWEEECLIILHGPNSYNLRLATSAAGSLILIMTLVSLACGSPAQKRDLKASSVEPPSILSTWGLWLRPWKKSLPQGVMPPRNISSPSSSVQSRGRTCGSGKSASKKWRRIDVFISTIVSSNTIAARWGDEREWRQVIAVQRPHSVC